MASQQEGQELVVGFTHTPNPIGLINKLNKLQLCWLQGGLLHYLNITFYLNTSYSPPSSTDTTYTLNALHPRL